MYSFSFYIHIYIYMMMHECLEKLVLSSIYIVDFYLLGVCEDKKGAWPQPCTNNKGGVDNPPPFPTSTHTHTKEGCEETDCYHYHIQDSIITPL